MLKILQFIVFVNLYLFCFCSTSSAIVLEDYLPKETRYNTSIPTPKAVTGIEVGERHYRHDQIIHYLSVLASSSNRAKLVDYGSTYEGRRLVFLFISSEKNIQRLNELATDENILKVWNGFSVHGNEASGANASVLYAYHLIAGYSENINAVLDDTLIIVDTTINPDGYDRFVTDVNSMRGMIDNTDANDRAHIESVPNGRTNHYWFDLNRDWLLLSQTESQSRVRQFHKWQPHVLDDHHEMGSERTFFFQPGVEDRTNPLIPKQNIKFTNELGVFHANALSEKGMRFFTKESYDDFYPGKGSTYPDLHGSVGILFEQASAKGGHLETKEGMRTLSQGIDNQFLTALSTLYGAHSIKDRLLQYKSEFYENAQNSAKKLAHKGYVIDFGKDLIKAQKFSDFIDIHNIKAYKLKKDATHNQHKYSAKTSLFIPFSQKQYTLIKSLFSEQKQFENNTFYDVSSWNIGMAWNLQYTKIKTVPETHEISWEHEFNNYQKEAIAYAFNWDQGNAPAALYFLQKQGITTRATSKTFTAQANGQSKSFDKGAIIIDVNKHNEKKVLTAIANISEFFQISSFAIINGLNIKGIDLGSPSIYTLKMPKILMVMGESINSYQAGSLWHLFDTGIGIGITKVFKSQLSSIELNNYTHIILPTGNYKSIDVKVHEKLIDWTKKGGVLIGLQQAAKWIEKNIQSFKAEKNKNTDDALVQKSYADFNDDQAQNSIGGAIVSAHADLSHPLGYGINNQEQFALMKGNAVLMPSKNPYATPIKAKNNALAAGYISDDKIQQINNSSLLIAEKMGQGTIIKFAFNPTFRGFWIGTQKWLINAIYFSQLIKDTKISK